MPADSRTLTLDGSGLALADIGAVSNGTADVALSDDAWQRIRTGRTIVDRITAQGVPAYGITTGVGSQKDFAIGDSERDSYNDRLVRAHATRASGPQATPGLLRATLAIQLNLFATGASGVRSKTAAALLDWLNDGDWLHDCPDVRLGQSVGASDLLANAQLADAFLDRSGIKLAAKEGLSLLNSNCLTLAQGALALDDLARLLSALDMAAAFTLEGFRGNADAWCAASDHLHSQAGQRTAGSHLRALLEGSRLWQSGEARLLQDPLSLRCVPQIHGTAYAALAWAREIWETELNAVVDNPAIDLAAGTAFSHGNMETSVLALSLDTLRLAVAKAVEASGERIHKNQWPAFTGLPVGLADDAGATGGVQFLNLGNLAAAHVVNCKGAATPVTGQFRGQLGDGVEDVAGMAPQAAAESERLAEAAWNVAAVEAIISAWAIDRRELPATAIGAGLRAPYAAIHQLLPIGHEGETVFDIEPIVRYLRDRESQP